LADVVGTLIQPFPDRPSEGTLNFAVEFAATATEEFEQSRNPPEIVEIARLCSRAVKESKALDLEALCVVHGERVWSIRVGITILDADGNLIDAAILVAMAALQHFRRPEITVVHEGGGEGEVSRSRVVVHHSDERAHIPLPLHHIPISTTLSLIPSNDSDSILALLDPCASEEALGFGRITFTTNAHKELCAVHKLGGIAISAAKLVALAHFSAQRATDVLAWLTDELQSAELSYKAERSLRIRGKNFVSSVGTFVPSEDPVEAGSLENLNKYTSYSQLHTTFTTADDASDVPNSSTVSDVSSELMAMVKLAAMKGSNDEKNIKRPRL
jgi:exosome complex component RRP45